MIQKSVHEGAVSALAEWIVGGRQVAGSSLPTEPEICARLGISRTVVREAVKTLAAKGLVTSGPRVGTRVRPAAQWNLYDPDVIRWRLAAGVDRTFVRDVIELRLAIEPAAAGLAAIRAGEADRAALAAALDAMDASLTGRSSYLDADLAFHRAVLQATHNQFLIGIGPLVEAILRVSFASSVKSRESARSSLPLHRGVMDRIASGAADAAEAAMRELIERARADIEANVPPDDFVEGLGQ